MQTEVDDPGSQAKANQGDRSLALRETGHRCLGGGTLASSASALMRMALVHSLVLASRLMNHASATLTSNGPVVLMS